MSALARQFVLDDMYQRVLRMVDGVFELYDRRMWFIETPLTGEACTLSEIPFCGPPWGRTEYRAYYYRWGNVYRWFAIPINIRGREFASNFYRKYATYALTPVLDNAIWSEISRTPNRAPVPINHVLGVIGNKQMRHERLIQAGYHVEIAFHQVENESMSVQRQYSNGFIRSFGFPGVAPTVLNTLDTHLALIQSIDTQSGPVAELDRRGNQGDRNFLAKLKAECYAIKDERGNTAARAAFDVYKMVAKYIDEGLTLEESA